MKNKTILPAFLVFVLLASCKKDLPTKSSWGEPQAIAENRSSQRAGLPNPFEYLGVIHNQAMDYVKNSRGFQNFDSYNRYSVVYQFTSEKFPSLKRNESEFELFKNEVMELVNADDRAPKVLYSKGRIDLQTKMLLDKIYQVFADCNVASETTEPSKIFEKLIAFEANLIREYGCPSSNLQNNTSIAAVLASSAIARYSYYYWYTVSKDPMNPWFKVLSNSVHKSTINWGQLLRTVKADFIGFWSSDGQSSGLNIGTAISNAIDASAE